MQRREANPHEAKITVMARFTITVIETVICESPTLTAKTSLEALSLSLSPLPVSFAKPNPPNASSIPRHSELTDI